MKLCGKIFKNLQSVLSVFPRLHFPCIELHNSKKLSLQNLVAFAINSLCA